jgi:hypothetical protein
MRSSLLGITTRNASQLVDDVVSREGAQHPHLPPAPLFGSRSLWGVAAGSQVFMPRPASSIHGSPLAWPPLDFSACAALIIAVFGRSFRLRPYADERHRTVATRAFGQFRRGRSDIAAVTRCRAFGCVAPAVLQTRPSGQIPSLRIARVPQPCARPLPSPASGRSSGLRPPAAVPGRGQQRFAPWRPEAAFCRACASCRASALDALGHEPCLPPLYHRLPFTDRRMISAVPQPSASPG